MSIYRIKDVSTGLYYTNSWRSWWNETGKLYTNKGTAERMLTKLTGIKKANRNTNTKIVLYGNEKSGKLRIVECEVKDKE